MCTGKCLKNRRKGVTFVEMLICILILGVALGTLLGSFLISKISVARARHRIEAMNHAQAAMETLINDQGATFVLPDGDIKDLGGAYVGTVANEASGIDRITVTISWNERSLGGTQALSEQLITFIRQ